MGLRKKLSRLQNKMSKKDGWNFAHMSVDVNVYVSVSVHAVSYFCLGHVGRTISKRREKVKEK
jgi:hypothetical protein